MMMKTAWSLFMTRFARMALHVMTCGAHMALHHFMVASLTHMILHHFMMAYLTRLTPRHFLIAFHLFSFGDPNPFIDDARY